MNARLYCTFVRMYNTPLILTYSATDSSFLTMYNACVPLAGAARHPDIVVEATIVK